MSKFSSVLVVVIAILCAATFVAYAKLHSPADRDAKLQSSQWPIGYSAHFTMQHATDPSKNCTGRMYVNILVEPRGLRRETVCSSRRRVSISTGDGTLVMIDPEAKVYWRPTTKARLEAVRRNSLKKFIAREKVDGRDAIHYEQSVQQSDGTTVIAQVWEDLRLHSTLRAVKPNETFELKNISEGAQPAYLFAIPDGFREIDPPKEQ